MEAASGSGLQLGLPFHVQRPKRSWRAEGDSRDGEVLVRGVCARVCSDDVCVPTGSVALIGFSKRHDPKGLRKRLYKQRPEVRFPF